MLLVGTDSQVRARFSRAQQNEAGFPVLRKVGVGIRLVHFARPFQASGAGQAPSLMANGWQNNARGLGGVPNVLFGFDHNGVFAPRRQQRDPENLG